MTMVFSLALHIIPILCWLTVLVNKVNAATYVF